MGSDSTSTETNNLKEAIQQVAFQQMIQSMKQNNATTANYSTNNTNNTITRNYSMNNTTNIPVTNNTVNNTANIPANNSTNNINKNDPIKKDKIKNNIAINYSRENSAKITNNRNKNYQIKNIKMIKKRNNHHTIVSNKQPKKDDQKDDKIKKGRDRLVEELDKLMNDPDINNCFGVDYWDPDAPILDVFHWQITLIPPKGTDYEGGFFKIEAKFSEEYPFVAPKMKFLTQIYHCNINDKGHICLNSIKEKWRKTFTMEDVLNHIIILLYKQNPNSPMNGAAANLYLQDKSKFKEKVQQYIKDYANINDYENLEKQKISLLEKCNCGWCKKEFRCS